jgi:cathepsin B
LLFSSVTSKNTPLISRESLEELKSKAKFDVIDFENHPFKDLSKNEIIHKLGLLPDEKFLWLKDIPYGNSLNELPDNFNIKDKWPQCLHPIRDQGFCGSCWAFAASEVLSDKFCIASNGKINVVLSPQDLVSCDGGNNGCNGGVVKRSWEYLQRVGIVTDTCLPYISDEGNSGLCPFGDEPMLNFCQSKEKFQKYKVNSHAGIRSISAAKNLIFSEGPIEAAFVIYEDFFSYKGGIYRRTSNNPVGGHSVKIIGWGKDSDGSEFWVAANSWNIFWGEEGFFRIAFGESGIESNLWTGTPDLNNLDI